MFGRPEPPPPPEPESSPLPVLVAILLCWGLPIFLAYLATAQAKAKKAAADAAAKGKVCVVVGASAGLGLELTRQLAARGSKVYATVRKPNKELSAIKGDVVVITGVDVCSDKVGAVLAEKLAGVKIDILMHNAGSYDGGVGNFKDPMALFGSQKLDGVTMETLKAVYEVNTFGALRVCKALHGNMVSPGGKVAIMSTQMGSIDDNTSGGSYAYRSSKAAVNMIGKSLSCDLKAKGVAVQLLAPGFVATSFGPGAEAMKKMGAKAVEPSVEGVVQALDAMGMHNTGCFVHCNYGLGLKNSMW